MPDTDRLDWSVILHGGAGDIPDDRAPIKRDRCLAALEPGERILSGGGSALDAVEAVIRALEDDPEFNAGFGSVLNADGEVEMDASIMDGSTLDIGAVCAIQGVRHPISVARLLLRKKPILLAADGARRFAEAAGAELCDAAEMIDQRQLSFEAVGKTYDTVGCVAFDRAGNIVAGTSTGGLRGKWAGRVGDSPLPGCGYYADNGLGGVSLSGEGESIARVLLAAAVMQQLDRTDLDAAIAANLLRLERVGGDAGIIGVDAYGRIGWGHNSKSFAVAYVTSAMDEPLAFASKSEEYKDTK